MGQMKCPRCGCEATPAEPFGEDLNEAEWTWRPHCSRCEMSLNDEGLALEIRTDSNEETQIIEWGKGDKIIWRYLQGDQRAEYLLKTISELGVALSQARDNVVSIATADLKWNHKRAKQRFKRWFAQTADGLATVADATLRRLAERILDEEPQPDTDEIFDKVWNETLSNENGHLDHIIGYETAKAAEPRLVFADLPDATRVALLEAREAWRWGLPIATVALCRLVLEEVVRGAAKESNAEGNLTPIFGYELAADNAGDTFSSLVSSIPNEVLPPLQKTKATKVWRRASGVLHGIDTKPDVVWIYEATLTIARMLLNRPPAN
jgi:hypothetical protein